MVLANILEPWLYDAATRLASLENITEKLHRCFWGVTVISRVFGIKPGAVRCGDPDVNIESTKRRRRRELVVYKSRVTDWKVINGICNFEDLVQNNVLEVGILKHVSEGIEVEQWFIHRY